MLEPTDIHLPGGVRFVPKPVKASTLLRLVREVADPRRPPAGRAALPGLKRNFSAGVRFMLLVLQQYSACDRVPRRWG